MSAINTQLNTGSTHSLRKRASYAMGQFAVVLNNQQLNRLITLLLEKIARSSQKSDTMIGLQCLSIIAKSIGNKLAPFLDQIIPLLSRIARSLKEDESGDEDNELSETALTTLEAIIRKCPVEVGPHVDDLLRTSFHLCEYDPNY